MRQFAKKFLFLWILLVSATSIAEPKESIFDLTQDACRYYSGEDFYHQSEFDPSSTPVNPLAASQLGQMIFSQNFRNSFQKYMYFVPDEELNTILNSDEFKRSLDHCFGESNRAKASFVFLLKKLEIEAKVAAGQSEALSLIAGGKFLGRAMNIVASKIGGAKVFFSWSFKVTGVLISYEIARQAVWFYNYSKGKRKRDEFKLNPAMLKKTAEDEAYSKKLALEALHHWKKEIDNLQINCDAQPEGLEKQKLKKLISQQLENYNQEISQLEHG